jgi:hypothetical protein
MVMNLGYFLQKKKAILMKNGSFSFAYIVAIFKCIVESIIHDWHVIFNNNVFQLILNSKVALPLFISPVISCLPRVLVATKIHTTHYVISPDNTKIGVTFLCLSHVSGKL